VRQWLDELRMRVAQCTTAAELDQIATSEDVRKAQQHFRNGAAEELNAIMADTMERFAEHASEEEVFPGDRA
jgi:hypothetical protein